MSRRVKCPVCGEVALESKQGTLRSIVPAGKPLAGRELLVEAAEWYECNECGESLLGGWLCKELQKKYNKHMEMLGCQTATTP